MFNDAGNRRRKRDLSGDFLMEPGRTMRVHLRACSKAHICSQVPVKPILVVRDKDTVAESKYGQITLKLEKQTHQNSTLVVKTTKPQKNGTLLVGGFLSTNDVLSQYLSAASDKFKTFVVNPDSTKDKTDRYLRNIIHRWDGQPVYIATLPDQTIKGPLSFTMSFDKTREQELKQDNQPRILRWCADEEMWIDAGRTCDSDGSNTHIDWENGLLTVKVCHSVNVCRAHKNSGKSKRSVHEFINAGVAEYAVASTNRTVSNSPPVITSDMTISIDEDTKFEYPIKAADPDGDSLAFLLDASAPKPSGKVTLRIDGKLSYTPCVNCYGEDRIQFTVMEKTTDDVAQPLSVDGTLVVEIRGNNDAPILHMFKEGRDIVPPSSRVEVTMEENSGHNSAYKDIIFILAAHDADYTDVLNMAFEAPKHGNLTVYSLVKNVDLTQQDCSKSWDARRHLWDKLVDGLTGSAAIQKMSLPNPCGSDFVSRHFAWVITAFRYTPFEQYFGEDIIKVKVADLISQDLLTIDVKVLRNPCINGGFCKGPESDPECKLTNRTTGFADYTCRCPRGYGGDYCETDVDECLSSPCQNNYTCIDRLDGFECYCPPDWPCHVTPFPLKTWQIVLISVGCFLVFLFVGCCVFCYHKSTPKGKFFLCTDLAAPSNGNHGRHRPDWIHGGPSSQNFHNPIYDETQPLNDTLSVDPGKPKRKTPRSLSSNMKTTHRPANEVEPIPDYD